MGKLMSDRDPMEAMIADALGFAGIPFDRNVPSPCGRREIDFWAPDLGVYIEVKRFHSERTEEQMTTVPHIIAAQGEDAVRALARLIMSSTDAGRAALAEARGERDA